jgi:hypothetical protein
VKITPEYFWVGGLGAVTLLPPHQREVKAKMPRGCGKRGFGEGADTSKKIKFYIT